VQRAPSQSLPVKLELRSGNKKKKKRKSTLGLNISPHPQTTPFTYTFRFVHVECGHRRNHPCQVSSQSVSAVSVPSGSNITISHRLGEWLLQKCYALTCYTVRTKTFRYSFRRVASFRRLSSSYKPITNVHYLHIPAGEVLRPPVRFGSLLFGRPFRHCIFYCSSSSTVFPLLGSFLS